VGLRGRDQLAAIEARRLGHQHQLFATPRIAQRDDRVPSLRPGDGVALAGALLSAVHRREIIERHDEDWFQNPRAIAELRHEDSLARDPALISLAEMHRAVELCAFEAELAIG